MGSGAHKKSGSFIGTGASKDIELDFSPKHVKVVNLTDLEWSEQFYEGGITGKEGGISCDVAGALTGLNAAEGIVLGERKFTVGTDNSANGTDDHMVFIAQE